jgi:hypothetical protein
MSGLSIVPVLGEPFDVFLRAFSGAMDGSGDPKVTRLELFSAGVLELGPEIRELIRAA